MKKLFLRFMFLAMAFGNEHLGAIFTEQQKIKALKEEGLLNEEVALQGDNLRLLIGNCFSDVDLKVMISPRICGTKTQMTKHDYLVRLVQDRFVNRDFALKGEIYWSIRANAKDMFIGLEYQGPQGTIDSFDPKHVQGQHVVAQQQPPAQPVIQQQPAALSTQAKIAAGAIALAAIAYGAYATLSAPAEVCAEGIKQLSYAKGNITDLSPIVVNALQQWQAGNFTNTTLLNQAQASLDRINQLKSDFDTACEQETTSECLRLCVKARQGNSTVVAEGVKRASDAMISAQDAERASKAEHDRQKTEAQLAQERAGRGRAEKEAADAQVRAQHKARQQAEEDRKKLEASEIDCKPRWSFFGSEDLLEGWCNYFNGNTGLVFEKK